MRTHFEKKTFEKRLYAFLVYLENFPQKKKIPFVIGNPRQQVYV